MNDTKKTANRTTAVDKTAKAFTEEERSAIQERAKEVKAAARRGAKADVESDVLAKIADMPAPDRAMAERIHAIAKASAPNLEPKLWYGQPAYAKDGKVICFFQSKSKFKVRYSTLGFQPDARLDEESEMWPTAFALTRLTPANEKRVAGLVKKAAG